jgi:hypothetical protein
MACDDDERAGEEAGVRGGINGRIFRNTQEITSEEARSNCFVGYGTAQVTLLGTATGYGRKKALLMSPEPAGIIAPASLGISRFQPTGVTPSEVGHAHALEPYLFPRSLVECA